MNKEKTTRIEYYEILKNIVRGDKESELTVTQAELIDFLDRQITSLKNKAIKAKEKAEQKKNEGDILKFAIRDILTEENQTMDEILNQLEIEDISKAKVAARLGQLIKAGEASKTEVKTEDGKRVMAYSLQK